MTFTFYSPTKIVFGQPAAESLNAELDALGATRLLLVSDPILAQMEWAQRVCLGAEEAGYVVSRFINVGSTPSVSEVAAGVALARDQDVQAIIALGGGSVIDVAKAIAMLLTNGGSCPDYLHGSRSIEQLGCPLITIPTTAGTGSEVSRAAVIVDSDVPFKQTVSSPLMYARTALLDPELTRSLPRSMTAATGLTAFVHALEAYTGRQTNPFTDQLAITALQMAWTYLPRVVSDGGDTTARQAMMLAALWGGMAMDQAGQGLIHALTAPLTAHLHLHHGLAKAVLLPWVLRFNLPAIPAPRRKRLHTALGLTVDAGDEALIERLRQFVGYLGLPIRLCDLDIPLNDFDWEVMAGEAMRLPSIANNPKPVSVADCEALLARVRD
jgi:alcohol dehydrogenase class IV